MTYNYFIRIADGEYKNLNEYTEEERKLIGKRLNEQAAASIVIRPAPDKTDTA